MPQRKVQSPRRDDTAESLILGREHHGESDLLRGRHSGKTDPLEGGWGDAFVHACVHDSSVSVKVLEPVRFYVHVHANVLPRVHVQENRFAGGTIPKGLVEGKRHIG